MLKEDLSIDITFNPCWFSLDSPFKAVMAKTFEKFSIWQKSDADQ
jgi:hypothetical protein